VTRPMLRPPAFLAVRSAASSVVPLIRPSNVMECRSLLMSAFARLAAVQSQLQYIRKPSQKGKESVIRSRCVHAEIAPLIREDQPFAKG
jgi:hypothetical protein